MGMGTRRTTYTAVANVYDAFLTLTGFKRGVENFLDRVAFDLPAQSKILDAGCGTGLVARYLARRFPRAKIYATDIDKSMLREMRRLIANDRTNGNVTLAVSDLENPGRLELLDGALCTIPEHSLDAVTVSGALEHVPLEASVAALTRLLKPGGIFFNLGMRRTPAGAVLGMVYHAKPYTLAEIRRAYTHSSLDNIRALRLGVEDFPANLSRIAIIARKGSA